MIQVRIAVASVGAVHSKCQNLRARVFSGPISQTSFENSSRSVTKSRWVSTTSESLQHEDGNQMWNAGIDNSRARQDRTRQNRTVKKVMQVEQRTNTLPQYYVCVWHYLLLKVLELVFKTHTNVQRQCLLFKLQQSKVQQKVESLK